MILGLVIPAGAALVIGLSVAGSHRHLHPRLAATTLVTAAGACTLAVMAAMATVAVGFLATAPWTEENLPWCTDLYRTHDEISPWLGIPAGGAVVWMVVAAAGSYWRDRRSLWHAGASDAELTVLPDEQPQAYALGGRRGHIVVSAGMLRLLSASERRVLLAHERSHLRNRHHGYIAVAGAARAALPLLAPVSKRLRLAVERWADEDAARDVGDRTLVACTIARAALAQADYPRPGALGIGHSAVAARVDALLRPSPVSTRLRDVAVAVGVAAMLALLGSSTVQFHHLAAFTSHVCGV